MPLPPLFLALAAETLLSQLGEIFHGIVLPVLILAGVGYLLQRRLGLDMATLSRLNFHFCIPCVIYRAVVTTKVGAGEVALIVGFSLALMALLAGLTVLVAPWAGVPSDRRNALLMTSIFYNSGNYGLPVQDLAFRSAGRSADAMALQVFVMIVQNITSFTVGIWLAANGKRKMTLGGVLRETLRFPPVYALALALLTVAVRAGFDEAAANQTAAWLNPIWVVIGYIYQAFIAIALCTLGAQLGSVRSTGSKDPIALSVVLRLMAGPLLACALIWAFGLHGFVAQVLLIGSAMPTSVNCMLLCLEFDNHPDYVARTVLYTTLLSPLTVTGVVLLARGGFWPALAY
ncbi:MAG: hypothetical protein AMXMBFR7_15880 [Planctomycetota bacterium]